MDVKFNGSLSFIQLEKMMERRITEEEIRDFGTDKFRLFLTTNIPTTGGFGFGVCHDGRRDTDKKTESAKGSKSLPCKELNPAFARR